MSQVPDSDHTWTMSRNVRSNADLQIESRAHLAIDGFIFICPTAALQKLAEISCLRCGRMGGVVPASH